MTKYFFIIYDLIILLLAIFIKTISFKSFDRKKYLSIKKVKKTIIIVNGPSLKKNIKNLIAKKDKFEFYVVNYFALKKEFKIIKPDIYVLADPVFWRKNINNEFKKDNFKLYNNLSKVNWDMSLLCPREGFKIVSLRLKKNKYIKVIPIKSNFFNFKIEKLNIFSLTKGITTPYFINVLILSLWHAIQRRIPYIEIYGADFSAFKEFRVNQQTNELNSLYTHYYKNTEAQKNADRKYKGKPKKKLHNRLFQIWNAFNQMYLLSVVAKKLKIKIINCSHNSYLDSIDRPKNIKK